MGGNRSGRYAGHRGPVPHGYVGRSQMRARIARIMEKRDRHISSTALDKILSAKVEWKDERGVTRDGLAYFPGWANAAGRFFMKDIASDDDLFKMVESALAIEAMVAENLGKMFVPEAPEPVEGFASAFIGAGMGDHTDVARMIAEQRAAKLREKEGA